MKRRKDGRYVATLRYTDESGRARRLSVYGKTPTETKARLREAQRRVEDGGPVVESSMTVGEWCERWVTVTLPTSGRRPTTQELYASLVRTHLVPALGAHRLRDLTVAHVEDWIADLGKRRSASTTRQAHGLLSVILDAAVRHELVRRNVAKGTDRPAKPRKEARHYTSEEVGAIRSAAEGRRLEHYLTLLAYTGMRRGEALALRWSDLDLDAERPSLRITATLSRVEGRLERTPPKTKAGRRTVPLVPVAVEALRDQRRRQAKDRLAAGPAWEDSGYVFTTEIGTPVDPRNVLRWFYTVRDAAGITGGSLHTFRHSAATVLLASGVPMPMVKDVLGHSSIAVTVDMYGHLAPSVVADAMAESLAGYGVAL